jgi:hypothetical protein
VCRDVLYGEVLSRRRFVEETFCMCANFSCLCTKGLNLFGHQNLISEKNCLKMLKNIKIQLSFP